MATRFGWLVALALMFPALLATAGCQSTRSPSRPVAMIPPAALDDTPRPKAVGPPRGIPGDGLSTAAMPKKLEGGEEASYEFPIPSAPKETVPLPKVDLPPAPSPTSIALTSTPPALPTAPAELPPAPPASPVAPPPGASNTPVALPPAPPAGLPIAPGVTIIGAPPTPPVSPIAPPPVTPGSSGVTIIGAPPTPVSQSPSLPGLAPPVAVEPKQVEPKQVDAKPTSNVAPRNESSPLVAVQSPDPNAADLVANLRSLHDKANQRLAQLDTYTMRIRRREVVAGKQRPEEIILAKFRQKPFSIYLKWVGDEGKNREVCYVLGKHEDVLHTLLAPGDMFLFGGKHFKVKCDSPLVQSNCRYPITDAGLGPIIGRFGKLVAAIEKGETREGAARYLGKIKRPEFEDPVEAVVQVLPAKYDALLPGGGQRFWYFDVKTGLPALIATFDHQGREVEYYCHDRVQGPANLDDDDFNPYRLWKTATK